MLLFLMAQKHEVFMKGICKSFSGLQALRHANFSAAPGQIHALLGENGAGKTTLMNILSGIYRQDMGEVHINGQMVSIRSPRDARRAGIGMVHQHFRLISTLSVAENIALVKSPIFFTPTALHKKAAWLMDQYGFHVRPDLKVADLSVGEAQKVEIAKALFMGIDVLILDEPTAVLTPRETEDLFILLREMCRQGLTIIFITHKLEEVLRFAERITIMRKGRTIKSLHVSSANVSVLSALMFGQAFDAWESAGRPMKEIALSREALILDRVSVFPGSGSCGIHGVNLTVRFGEIIGIAGVSGNGQQALAELLIGIRKAQSGRVVLDQTEMDHPSPRDFIRRGVAYVPGDRLGEGLCPGLGAVDNLLLKRHADAPYASFGLMNLPLAKRKTKEILSRYGAKIRGLDAPVSLLSGGNLQRLILGRELHQQVRLLVAVNPSRGLDLQGITLLRDKLRELADRGVAVVIISEDLEELQEVADRMHVIYNGRLSVGFDRGCGETPDMGRMMGGVGFADA